MNKEAIKDFLSFFIPLVLFGWGLIWLINNVWCPLPKTPPELVTEPRLVKWINYPGIGDTCEILSEVYDIYGTEYAEIRSPFFRRSKIVDGFAHYDWPVDSIACSKPMQDTIRIGSWRHYYPEYETLAVVDTATFRKPQ